MALTHAAHGAREYQAILTRGRHPAAFGSWRQYIQPRSQSLRRRQGTIAFHGQSASDGCLFDDIRRHHASQAANARCRLTVELKLRLEGIAGQCTPIGQTQACYVLCLFQQVIFQPAIILKVAFFLPALGAIKRRLRDIQIPARNQFGHLPEEEGQQ